MANDYGYTGMESAFVSSPMEVDLNVFTGQNKSNDDKQEQKAAIARQPTPGQTAVQKSNVGDYTIKPLKNPLGDYSSYTYQITLYMSTPDAINRFVQNGKFDPKDDHYIVAQSGGIGLDEKRGLTNTGELGPKKLGMDYYIDDFELKHVLTGTDGSPTVNTEIKFKIIEPIGFNFFTQLSEISDKLNNLSQIVKESNPEVKPPPLSQNYLIGIRFYGYDASGNLVPSLDHTNFFNSQEKYLKSAVSEYANFEYFFTVLITTLSYQIDGRVVTYFVEGTPVAKQIGHGTKFGLLNSVQTLVGTTVEEVLGGNKSSGSNASRSLMQVMNEQEQAKKDTNRSEKTIGYSIEWGEETETLRNGKLIDDPMFKNAAPTSEAKTPAGVNPRTAQAAQSININAKQSTIPAGTPVLMIMDQIMAKSTYVTEKLIMQNDQSIESKSRPNASTSEIKWYSINPIVKITGRDSITKDWVYEITYKIEMQRIEYIRALYVNHASSWRGTHKEYNFFLTGENSEIISFEQKYDNQFYLLQAMSTNSVVQNEKNTVPAHSAGGTANKPIGGDANQGSIVAAEVAIRMNSIADQATASIKIVGDPHYIMSNVGGIYKYSSAQFGARYNASALTMNPYRNQIWVNILFKGATDYKQDGTLQLKEVDFYSIIDKKNPNTANSGIKGIIYRVLEVTSNFTNGRFTQNLEMILVGANQLNIANDKKNENQRETDSKSSASLPSGPRSISDRERAAFLEANISPVRRGGTIAELRRNVYVAGETTSSPNDDTNSSKTKNPRQATFGNTTIPLIDPRESKNLAQVQAQNPPSRP